MLAGLGHAVAWWQVDCRPPARGMHFHRNLKQPRLSRTCQPARKLPSSWRILPSTWSSLTQDTAGMAKHGKASCTSTMKHGCGSQCPEAATQNQGLTKTRALAPPNPCAFAHTDPQGSLMVLASKGSQYKERSAPSTSEPLHPVLPSLCGPWTALRRRSPGGRCLGLPPQGRRGQ